MDRLWQLETALQARRWRGPARACRDRACARAALRISRCDDLVLRRRAASDYGRCRTLTLAPGDRLLVERRVGLGQVDAVPRALTGNWPFGEGKIRMPDTARACSRCRRGRIFRSARCGRRSPCPTPADEVTDADIARRHAHGGLQHLIDRLDEEAEWTTVLSAGEQHRIGFAARSFIVPACCCSTMRTPRPRAAGREEFYDCWRSGSRNDHHVREQLDDARGLAPAHDQDWANSSRPRRRPKRVLAIATPVCNAQTATQQHHADRRDRAARGARREANRHAVGREADGKADRVQRQRRRDEARAIGQRRGAAPAARRHGS